MTSWQFEAAPLPFRRRARAAASRPGGGKRPSLAIVSVFDELCGIAAYTHFLRQQLSEVFEVTVFELDQYLLRSTHRTLRRLGDRHIKEICRQLAAFDAVNLQLEHGTLGRLAPDIYRRFSRLVAASPQISVTFHTVVPIPEFDTVAWLRALLRLRLPTAMRLKSDYLRQSLLSAGLAHRLRRAQRRKPVAVIVHNRRDQRQMRLIHGIRRVWDHPLAFLGRAQAAEIRNTASRARFPLLDAVPADAKLLGVFGFFGRYKGFDTVLRAMHRLPPEYHLLVFGSVHPNEIRSQQPIDPNIAALFEAGHIDASLVELLRPRPGGSAPGLSIAIDADSQHLLLSHPKDLVGRVHFMGALGHADFLAGMAICDAVVMPYLEVGQSASGPISQALELGCRTIASRTRTFLQLARYHPDMIEFFDIGNHVELAELLAARPRFDPHERSLAFDVETNKAVYLAANRRPGKRGAAAPEPSPLRPAAGAAGRLRTLASGAAPETHPASRPD